MKLAGPDLILFVVGLLLFAGAGYGLIATGSDLSGGGGALGLFQVTYPTETVELDAEAVPDLGGTHDVTFEVDAIDLTEVTVAVACGGPAAGLPYTLVVRVAGPNSLAGDASGGCGTSVTVPVSEVPPTTTVRGADADDAHHNLGEHPNATRGQGTWTVTVSGSRGTGGVPLPGPGPSGTVSFAYERWTHAFTAVPPK
jgi:hypothetical protein